jgi:hypothetical protein
MADAAARSTRTLSRKGGAEAEARRVRRGGLVLALLFCVTAAVGVACGSIGGDPLGPPDKPEPTGSGGSGGSGGAGGGGPCTDGQTRDCHVTLGEHNGILSCFDGVEHCQGGAWGPCVDGTVSSRPAPPQPAPQPARAEDDGTGVVILNHTDAGAGPCVNNPCDPSCQVFDEDPDAGLKPDGTVPSFGWESGNLGDFPGGLVNKGLKEPCAQASDCQFNMQCKSPASGTCAHSKCAVGIGLYPDCDPCVKSICTADPSCCLIPYGGTCAHDPCIQGVGLKTSCSTCVKKVCDSKASCCTGTWDASCVTLFEGFCPKTCAGVTGDWTQSCVDKVYSVCGSQCQADPPCVHDKCYSGAPLAAACDPCVAKICQQSPYCCTSKWDNLCVDKVKTTCAESCPVKGDCVPWLPNEKDPKCPGIDLSLGVPCNGSVPVCNHGNTVAPSGIKLIHFPANSNQYPKCEPDQSHPAMVTCTTNKPIPPGQCISVTTCGLGNGNREIMVNPPGAGQVAECFCQNNWTLHSGGGNSCAPPSCSSVTSRTIRKVNMFVQFDRSGSMTTNDRWGKATSALKAFFADPASGGLGVALRFWEHWKPIQGCDDTNCSTNACSVPLVSLGTLTTQPSPTDTHEKALIDAVNSVTPAADTPMYPALAGALKWAKDNQLAKPKEQFIVVLVTDGYPNSCNTDPVAIAQLSEDALTSAGVLTYAIGIQDANVQLMNNIASKGGTGTAFFISDQGDVQEQLLDAMLQIKGDTVACEFDLPNQGLFDPGNAKVVFVPSAGNPVAYPKVASAAACGNGWYFDNAANPTKILLCPNTCQSVLADTGARIDVDLGCPGAYEPSTYTHVYQAKCPAGTRVQWGFLAYDTVTPGNSSVIFSARTATTNAGLAAASYTSLATAQVAPTDTQICSMAGPSPCPVDLYTKLNLPAAQQEFLQLSIAMNPTSDKASAPVVKSWDLTYSCPPSE